MHRHEDAGGGDSGPLFPQIAVAADPAPTTPEEFAAYIKNEVTKWARVVKDSGARVD